MASDWQVGAAARPISEAPSRCLGLLDNQKYGNRALAVNQRFRDPPVGGLTVIPAGVGLLLPRTYGITRRPGCECPRRRAREPGLHRDSGGGRWSARLLVRLPRRH